MASDSQRQLADFIIGKAFEPVMRARPDGRPEGERRMLQRDLTSAPAKKVHGP